MILFSFVISAFFAATNTAHAQVDWWDKGNGGFVLACPGQNLRTFDLYELQDRYVVLMSLDKSHSANLEERINYLLDKIAVLNPARAQKYKKWFLEFFNELRFTNNSLQAASDIGFGQVPVGCSLELTIFQRNPDINNPYRYTVRKALWDELAVIEKAALVLHELIYREAIQVDNRQLTSERSRFFNAWINSEEFSRASLKEYISRLQSLQFRDAEYGSHQIYLGHYNENKNSWEKSDLKFFESGSAATITVGAKDAAASQLISSKVRACLEDKMAVGVLHLDEAGQPVSWQTTLSESEVCAFEIQNFDIENLKGFNGTILGSQFHFFDQQRFEVSGTYNYPYRFYFYAHRFDLFSPEIQIKQVLNGDRVERIVFSDIAICRSSVANWIQVVTSKPSTVEFNLNDFKIQIERLPTCRF